MSEEPGHTSQQHRLVKWVIGLSAIFVVTAAFALTRGNSPIPDPSEIRSMEASLRDPAGQQLTFTVPPDHWASVLDALEPYEVDPDPAKWQVLGLITIDRPYRGDVRIGLFETDPPGAFQVTGLFGWRTYYRGGDSATLKDALDKAYKASLDAAPETK